MAAVAHWPRDGVLVTGEVPGRLQRPAEVPLGKVPKPQILTKEMSISASLLLISTKTSFCFALELLKASVREDQKCQHS